MITISAEFKLKKDADIRPVINKLQSYAVTFTGFQKAENLVDVNDPSHVSVISSWNKAIDWQAWEESKNSQAILNEADGLLLEKPRISIYVSLAHDEWID